jgi:glyoxylase-like metal-dependent hydrolase (beta-lactamase superfamily II)
MSRLKVIVVPVTPLQQNCSLVIDTETQRAAVVDPGGDIPLILNAITKAGVTVEKILLTHGHIDHAGGAAELREALQVPVEGPEREDDFLLQTLAETGVRYGIMAARAVTPERWLSHDDTVTVGGIGFRVIHAPGHSPGSVVYFQPEAKFALMGDVLFQGSIGRTDLPRGSYDQLMASIHGRILTLGDEVVFLPGHGSASQIGHERETNPFIREMEESAE